MKKNNLFNIYIFLRFYFLSADPVTASSNIKSSYQVKATNFGIAVSPNGSKVYASNLISSNVSIIEVKSTEKKNFFQILSSLEIAHLP